MMRKSNNQIKQTNTQPTKTQLEKGKLKKKEPISKILAIQPRDLET
jgi:hypothetical protein